MLSMFYFMFVFGYKQNGNEKGDTFSYSELGQDMTSKPVLYHATFHYVSAYLCFISCYIPLCVCIYLFYSGVPLQSIFRICNIQVSTDLVMAGYRKNVNNFHMKANADRRWQQCLPPTVSSKVVFRVNYVYLTTTKIQITTI